MRTGSKHLLWLPYISIRAKHPESLVVEHNPKSESFVFTPLFTSSCDLWHHHTLLPIIGSKISTMSTSAGTGGSGGVRTRSQARHTAATTTAAEQRTNVGGASSSATANDSSRSSLTKGIFQRPQPFRFSELSTPAIPDSLYFSQDFRLGAGMVVFQPSTDKVNRRQSIGNTAGYLLIFPSILSEHIGPNRLWWVP
jgi:hypothetical protein